MKIRLSIAVVAVAATAASRAWTPCTSATAPRVSCPAGSTAMERR